MTQFLTPVSGSIWQKKSKNISAGLTVVLDSIPFTTLEALKYIITAFSKTENKRIYLEVAIIKDQTSIKDTVSNKIKSGLNIEVSPIVTGANFNLNIKNNEIFTIKVEIVKLKIG